MDKYVVIVAGGSGLRMKSDIPKQFIVVNGMPILMHTVTKFFSIDSSINIILVLPKMHIDYWQNLCKEHDFIIKHTIIQGGETRFHSVKNGLKHCTGGVVAIHDGVRPFVSEETVNNCFSNALQYNSAIPVCVSVESVRVVDEKSSKPLDRNKVMLVQTPQTFKTELIKEAYNIDFLEEFTDDASVFEKSGYNVVLVDGNNENIKITTQKDVVFAEFILKHS